MKTGKTKLFIVIAVLVVIFLPPFVKYQRLLYKKRRLDAQIRELTKESKRLEAEKKRLQTDVTYVEKKAREKMGVVRKGEIVLKETAEKPAKQPSKK